MDIRKLDLTLLTDNELKAYNSLTPPENRCYLRQQNPSGSKDLTYLALGAFEESVPVGLLLATGAEELYITDLRSLYVDEKRRCQYIGTALFKAFNEELKKAKAALGTVLYPTDLKTIAYFEKILAYGNWKTPTPFLYRYFFKGADFKPPWIFKNYCYTARITSFLWSDLTPQELQKLRKRDELDHFPPHLSPFINESSTEPLNSLALKKEDEIIGWMITHRLDESTIRYSTLYVEPKYQFRGFAIKLLLDAIKIQKKLIEEGHPAIFAVFDLNLSQTGSNWHQFIERRLAPFAQKTTLFNFSWTNFQ